MKVKEYVNARYKHMNIILMLHKYLNSDLSEALKATKYMKIANSV
jgi:hypothetical protein